MFKESNTYSKNSHNSSGEKLSEAGNKIIHDFHDLKNDARALKMDIKNAAHTAADVARHTGAQVRGVAETVIDAPGSFKNKIRNNPVQSAFIAFVAGMVIGKMQRR